MPTLPNLNTPCADLTAKSNNTEFQSKMTELSQDAAGFYETGRVMYKTSPSYDPKVSGGVDSNGNSTLELPYDPVRIPNITGFMHCHLNRMDLPLLRTLSIQDTYDIDFDLKEGDYLKDTQNQLNSYIGTWKYEGNGKTLILRIQKIEMFYNGISENYRDKLLITYKYIKNGNTLVDNLNAPIITTFKNIESETGKKYGTFGLSRNESFLTGSLTDIPLNILTNAEIHPTNPTNGTFTKIKIYYNGMISTRGNPDSFYVGKPTFELPNSVELIKQ